VNDDPILVARHVEKRFGPTEALRGVDVTIAGGEVVAVTGPSGAGKSTLLHCLSGILRPDAGEVWFAGRRIDVLGEAERAALRRRQFGFVFQFGQLVAELPAVENVALPLLLDGIGRREAQARAMEWLERLDASDVAGAMPDAMSGGQAQRVAMARALVTGPRVVFADEPTGALDSLAGEEVMTLLTSHASAQATTVILITHEARVAAYAVREIVLRDGIVTNAALVQ
jgi:putative ABC transport system ATP-binding protein